MVSQIWYQNHKQERNASFRHHPIQNFGEPKDIIKNVQRQFTEWRRYFANHISDNILSRIYKELLQLSNKKINNQVKADKESE